MRLTPKTKDNRLHVSLPPEVAEKVRAIRETYNDLCEALRPNDSTIVVAAILAMYAQRCERKARQELNYSNESEPHDWP